MDTSEVYDALVTAILNGIRDDSSFQEAGLQIYALFEYDHRERNLPSSL